jgi:proteasome accessory factor B
LFGVYGAGKSLSYRLRFTSEVARYILERQWHPTQKIRRRPDGSVDLAFCCQESFEVSAWVVSWRENVSVLAPASLRRELRELGSSSLTDTSARIRASPH